VALGSPQFIFFKRKKLLVNLPDRIILMGAMGAGKTTIGNILASHLGAPYLDNDDELALLTGMTPEQLSTIGVDELHRLEDLYLLNLSRRSAPWIAGVAGSVVDNSENFPLMQPIFSIYLYRSIESLLINTGKTGVGRQALSFGAQEIIRARFERRDPRYRQLASFEVAISDDPLADVGKILAAIK
jgi:shikimate kinase